MATLTPAFGRDYKNKYDALRDWNAGKNFVYCEREVCSYVNKENCPVGHHQIRYSNLRKVITIYHNQEAK